MSNHRKSKIENRKSLGFTLIELLLVIGIILILIGILVPTVGQVRVAAQTANTKQMISRLEAGIQSYYNDFQAYPGPFSNAQISNNSTGINAFQMDGSNGTATNLTSTENLFLGVVGGLRIVPPNLNAVFTSTSLPGGPTSLNTLNPKRHSLYVTIEGRETTALTAPRFFPGNGKGLGGSADTIVPEILDKYSEPMPILYLRANRGSTGFVTTDNGGQYNFSQLAPYGFTSISTDFATSGNDGSVPRSYKYFGNEAVGGTVPHKKDAFILISAGPDGRYGTSDDKTNYRAN